jgi:hypothetical protein
VTIQDIINRAAPALIGLAAELEAAIAKYPDLAGSLQPKADALKAAADPLALAQLGSTVLNELTQFARTGTLDPRRSPSNLA